MPLQKRDPFVPNRRPPDLRPEEEVFFCPLTKEIFRDYDGKKLKEELKAPHPSRFKYDVVFMEDDSSSSSSESSSEDEEEEKPKKTRDLKRDIFHSSIFRQRSNVTKVKLKLFLKSACEVIGDKWTVKPQIAEEYDLSSLSWTDVFAGTMPQFPKTPLSKRTSNVSTPGGAPRTASPATSDASASTGKTKKQSNKKKSPKKPTKEQIRKMEELRKREEEERRLAKLREKQREELNILLSQASHLGVTDLSVWTEIPLTRMVTVEEMNDLRLAIKKAREDERERVKEEKKREKEAFLEWKKPRDDLECDDLKPLPEFIPVVLPEGLTPQMFGDILSLLEFFHCFKDQMTHETDVTLRTVVEALFNRDPGGALTDLFVILLEALSTRQDEEDGDEANLENKEELQCENSDLDSRLYGEWIKNATAASENIRLTHGVSIRNLHRDASTITELIRLNLEASGYYTGQATARFRYLQRGGYRCYDDQGLLYKMTHPDIMHKLARHSVLLLTPSERLELLKVFSDQLLTFYAFRDAEDDRIEKLKQLKSEVRQLKMSEQQMEREAKNSLLKREYEEKAKELIREREELKKSGELGENSADQIPVIELPERPKPGKSSLKLKKLLTTMREGGAYATFDSRGRTPAGQSPSSDVTDKIGDLLAKVIFGELETEEIGEVRNLQKEKFLAEEEKLYEDIYDLQTSCGLGYLGRDRAYRNYWVSGALPGLFVEEPSLDLGPCEEATPLDKVPQRDLDDVPLKGHDQAGADAELRLSLLACSGHEETCAVHGERREDSRHSWSFLGSPETLAHLLDSLNPRGFRETELAENIRFLRPRLEKVTRKMMEGWEKRGRRVVMDHWTDEGISGRILEDQTEEAVRESIRDLEEKVHSGGIGSLKVKNRDVWRETLTPGRQIDLQTGCVRLDGDVIYEGEEVEGLETVPRLAVALLQVAQGINFKFMKLPFVEEATEQDRDTGEIRVLAGELVPTLCFRMWQRSLVESTSMSQIALHSWTLEPTVQWKKSKLQAKCRLCRKRGNPLNLVLCAACNVAYHTDCVKPVLRSVPDSWKCRDCAAVEKETLRREQRRLRDEERAAAAAAVPEENGVGEKAPKAFKGDLFDAEMSSESESDTAEDCGECGGQIPPKQKCVCDDCNTVYHVRCVGLRARPKTDWLCADCRPETNGVDEETEGKEAEPLISQRGRVVKRKRTFDEDDERPTTSSSSHRTPKHSSASATTSYSNSRASSGRTTPTENGYGPHDGEMTSKKVAKMRGRHSAIGADLSEEDIRSLSMGLRGKGGLSPDQTRMCVALVEDARRHEDAWPFLNPVDKKTPMYYKVIESPVDLRTILNKLKGHRYDALGEFTLDVKQMFENCRVFNEDGSVVSQCGNRLERYLLTNMKELFANFEEEPVQKKSRRSL